MTWRGNFPLNHVSFEQALPKETSDSATSWRFDWLLSVSCSPWPNNDLLIVSNWKNTKICSKFSSAKYNDRALSAFQRAIETTILWFYGCTFSIKRWKASKKIKNIMPTNLSKYTTFTITIFTTLYELPTQIIYQTAWSWCQNKDANLGFLFPGGKTLIQVTSPSKSE